MPRATSVPKYRHFKPRNLAVVRCAPRPASATSTWAPTTAPRAEPSTPASSRNSRPRTRSDLPVAGDIGKCASVDEVLLGFLAHAARHYAGPGRENRPTGRAGEIKRSVLHPAPAAHGHTAAADFGPRAMARSVQEMIKAGSCRTLINRRMERVKRLFKWATSQELVPVTVYRARRTCGPLQGRSEARSPNPSRPSICRPSPPPCRS